MTAEMLEAEKRVAAAVRGQEAARHAGGQHPEERQARGRAAGPGAGHRQPLRRTGPAAGGNGQNGNQTQEKVKVVNY